MVNQPTNTPFGLQPNVAAGLAYLLGIIGGIIMLVGGGTDKFVKWAACQSITMGGLYILYYVVVGIIMRFAWALLGIIFFINMIVALVYLAAWLWTFITAFQGKQVEVPVVAGITKSIFGSQLA